MKKQLIIFILLTISLFSIIEVVAQDEVPFEEKEYHKPIIEILDLMVDGSITPVLINLTKEYDYIKMISVSIVWRENSIDFDHYGLLPRLTNGTEFLYDNEILIEALQCFKCYLDFAVDSIITSDDKNPIDNHFIAHIHFHDHLIEEGLKMKEGHIFNVRINDNLTAVGSEHSVRIFGYRIIDKGYEFRQSFLEEVMDVDNPLELLLWPLVIPLAFIFTGEPISFIMGVSIFIVEIIIIAKIWSYWRY